jgi:hypothetical protein
MISMVKIIVLQLVPEEELDSDDQHQDIEGVYSYEIMDTGTAAEEKALDQFHEDVAIACLEDFDIEARTISQRPIPDINAT